MRIAHIADIHVKDRRRKEYAAVFAALAAQLKAEDPRPAAVAVAGDVFDTMSKASARNWEDVATLLSLLAQVAPVVVIPGNHDLNVRAAGAPDLIGPMLEAAGGARDLQPPRVTYWRASGVREFAGAVWAAGVPGQPPPTLEAVSAALAAAPPGTPLVGLYHESVGGALYPNGIEAGETPLSKNDLGALARVAGAGRPLAVLLGDIHLRQEVSFPGSGAAAAAWYPGSLVCQNFGEPHLGHGYLLWDLEVGAAPAIRVTPRDIPNPRAPLTIRLGPAGEDLTPEPRPENPRAYRIAHAPAAAPEAVEVAVAAAAARYGYAPRSVEAFKASARPSTALQQEGGIPPSPTATLAAAQAAGGDWAQHAALARALLEEAKTPPEIASAALIRYEAAVAANLGAHGAAPRAELVRLEFDDMFCYGPGNIVDFDALRRGRPGLVGFVAPNRAGKSSLFDILTFALCDEVSRGMKRDISRRGGPGYRLRLTFRVDGIEGCLEKSGGRGELKRGEHAIRLWLGGEELTADTTPETAARARELLGARRWLDAVTFLRPAEISGVPPFALATAAERRETLSALLDLGAFENLYKSAGIELSELRGERRAFLRRWPSAASWKEGEVSLPLAAEGVMLKDTALAAGSALDDAQAGMNAAENRARLTGQAAAEATLAVAGAEALHTEATRARAAAKVAAIEAAAAETRAAELAAAGQTAAAVKQEEAAEREQARAEEATEEATNQAEQARAEVVVHHARILEIRAHTCACEGRRDSARQREQIAAGACPSHAPSTAARNLARCATAEPPAEEALDAALDALEAVRKEVAIPSPSEFTARKRAGDLAASAKKLRDQATSLAAVCAALAIPTDVPSASPSSASPALELGQTLKSLKTAREEARIYEELRAEVAGVLKPEECPGCAAAKKVLGGDAADRVAALSHRAAGLSPLALAFLKHCALDLEEEAAVAATQASTLKESRQKRLTFAETSVTQARVAVTRARAIRAAQEEVAMWERASAEAARLAAAAAVAEEELAITRASLASEEEEATRLAREMAQAKTKLQTAASALAQARVATVGAREQVATTRIATAWGEAAREQASKLWEALAVIKARAERASAEAACAAKAAAGGAEARAEGAEAQKAESVARSNLITATSAFERATAAYVAHQEAAAAAIEADRSVAVSTAYRKILHPKNGVGACLLTGAAEGIGAEVAAALKEMDASFGIEFGADFELTLIDKASGTRTSPALGSGYQQFVSALAARWALAKVARVPLPACFMIDEGFGCLDEENLPRVAEALGALALRAPAGGESPLVLAVTHREDMAPYFTERLEITTGAAGSRVTYPAGAEVDLNGITLHAAHTLPSRRCEACGDDVAALAWEAHVRSARHAAAMARGPLPADTYCGVCEREITFSRWAKHSSTAAHAKAAAAQAARNKVVAAHLDIAGPAPRCKIACLTCPNGPAFTAEQWARHVASARHRATVE